MNDHPTGPQLSIHRLHRLHLTEVMNLQVAFTLALVIGSAQPSAANPAIPLDPITAVLEAFRAHNIVALGDGAHNSEQSHTFRIALIRDPRFAATVNDIVVECGNARYQDLMDRFAAGEEVPDASLRQVWRNTTTPTALWDL